MQTPFVFRLVGPETLLADPDPGSVEAPGPGQVTTQSVVSAISIGTELAAWRGDPPLRPTASIYPRLMGYCHVGRITAVGDGVGGWSVGDLALSHSAHRSHDRVGANELLCPVPQRADLAAASTTYLFHLGYNACLKAGVTAGHSVAVVGLGTLGLTSAAIAHMAGATVRGYSNRSGPGEAFGLSGVYPKSTTDHDNRADVVITTSNTWDDWTLALRLARRGGTIVVLGFPGRGQPPVEENPLASRYFYDKQLTLTACGYTPDLDVPAQDLRFTLKRNCAFLLDTILAGRLPAPALIAGVRDARELPQIYAEMAGRRKGPQTYVLDWKPLVGDTP